MNKPFKPGQVILTDKNLQPLEELDPHGTDAHSPGAKLDAGKPRIGLVLGAFAHALWEVSRVGTFGATKYTDNGWLEVPDAKARYTDAGLRHFLKEAMGEETDSDSDLYHLAHEAWNALARLELLIREKKASDEISDLTVTTKKASV